MSSWQEKKKRIPLEVWLAAGGFLVLAALLWLAGMLASGEWDWWRVRF